VSLIPTRLRRLVARRAAGRCEYCGLSQVGQEATFHVDHVTPRQAGGPTTVENLALACVSCSLRKEARRTASDPETGRVVPLFDPRRQRWDRHFRWNGVRVAGISATGRATVTALRLNRPLILSIRDEEVARGRHPPKISRRRKGGSD
jgi:hypothetical protein